MYKGQMHPLLTAHRPVHHHIWGVQQQLHHLEISSAGSVLQRWIPIHTKVGVGARLQQSTHHLQIHSMRRSRSAIASDCTMHNCTKQSKNDCMRALQNIHWSSLVNQPLRLHTGQLKPGLSRGFPSLDSHGHFCQM